MGTPLTRETVLSENASTLEVDKMSSPWWLAVTASEWITCEFSMSPQKWCAMGIMPSSRNEPIHSTTQTKTLKASLCTTSALKRRRIQEPCEPRSPLHRIGQAVLVPRGCNKVCMSIANMRWASHSHLQNLTLSLWIGEVCSNKNPSLAPTSRTSSSPTDLALRRLSPYQSLQARLRDRILTALGKTRFSTYLQSSTRRTPLPSLQALATTSCKKSEKSRQKVGNKWATSRLLFAQLFITGLNGPNKAFFCLVL